MVSREEAIETIKQMCCGDCESEEENFWSGNCTCECAECCNKAISDIQKLEKIEQILDDIEDYEHEDFEFDLILIEKIVKGED